MLKPNRAEPRMGTSPGEWALMALPALMLAVLLLRPSTNSDLFWQLKLGEMTLAAMAPITVEPFSAPHLGEATPALAWLGQALFAAVKNVAGWSGLRLFDAVCWCGGFWAVAWASRRQGASSWGIAIGLGLGFVAALPTAILRAQNFAALCFGLLLALLRVPAGAGLKIAIGSGLLVVWQNLHPSVSLAIGVLAIHATIGWLARLRSEQAPIPLAETVLLPIAALAMFCTPDGWSILALSAQNSAMSIAIGAGEWLPLWSPVNAELALPIGICAVLAGWIGWRSRARLDLAEVVTCAALLLVTLFAYRFVLFWAIALVPVLARSAATTGSGSRRTLAAAMLGIVLVGSVLSLTRPVTFREHLALPALERLKQANVTGTVFADFPFGGPLIHVGYPQWRVAFDGRYYRYTSEEWNRFAAIQAGTYRLRDIEARYRPAALVLQPRRNAVLIREVLAHPERWQRLWADHTAVIFIPSLPGKSAEKALIAAKP